MRPQNEAENEAAKYGVMPDIWLWHFGHGQGLLAVAGQFHYAKAICMR